MQSQETIFEATDNLLETLRDIEDAFPDFSEQKKKVFTARRRLQKAQDDYLKQGDRIAVTKEFVLHCSECNQVQMREEDYYLHLRQKHDYPDEDAASESNNPRSNYEQDIEQLRNLISTYTEVMLEDA